VFVARLPKVARIAIFTYQRVVLQRHHQEADRRVGLKAFLRAA